MNDKELVESAAHAVGITGMWDSFANVFVPTHGRRLTWHPLADREDALTLAIALKISIVYDGVGHVLIGRTACFDHEVVLPEDAGEEDVCRAITFVGAVIGKQMMEKK